MKSLNTKEKTVLIILISIIALIALGLIALLFLSGGPFAAPQLSHEEAIAKWHDPVGVSITISLACEEALAVAKTPKKTSWIPRLNLSLVVHPSLILNRSTLNQWRPGNDQEKLEAQLNDNIALLITTIEDMMANFDDKPDGHYSKPIETQCNTIATLDNIIIKQAKADGITETDIKNILDEEE